MPVYAFEGKRPRIGTSTYVAPSAQIIGNVRLGERCYVGPGAIVRGDYGMVIVGDETAIEEGVIIHARPQDVTQIGDRVTLGHGAMVHNATICDRAVIGMRAVISDYAEVGEGAIVGEMSLVKNKQVIPPGKIAVGIPAEIKGDVGERHVMMTKVAKDIYVDLAARYLGGALEEVADLRADPWMPALVPIGVIHTPFSGATGTPIQGALARQSEGEIIVDPSYEDGLADLDGFSHVVVLFALHRAKQYRLHVTPYLDTTPRGLFSTRAPSRPNPIGMTVVQLLGVDGRKLTVRGVDMFDGTPLLDLKPYVPLFDAKGEVRCGWLEPHLPELAHLESPPMADDRFHPPKPSND